MPNVQVKSNQEIETMKRAGAITAALLSVLKEKVVPGADGLSIDAFAEAFIREEGGLPAFKGYRGYQHTTCISVNEQVVHGIPNDRKFQEGDIVGVDVGVIVDGYYSDAARTFSVGTVSGEAQRLIEVTKASLAVGIEEVRHGAKVGDISHAIQTHAESQGYAVVRDLFGHGIGTALHEEPLIPNFGKQGTGMSLKAGMVIAIEPMLNIGTHRIKVEPDGWTVVTEDASLSAHFEDTVLVRRGRAEVLTEVADAGK